MQRKMVVTALAIGALACFPSCNKVKDEILKNIDPFTYAQEHVTFEIPAQPIVLPLEFTTPEQTETIYINQIIKDNSGLNVNIDDFSYIKLKDATLKLMNGDAANNWTNIEYIEAQANTDKGLNTGKAWLVTRLDIPNDPAVKYSDKTLSFPDENLKDYVNGDEATVVHYKWKVKPRLGTTINLNVDATIRYEFKP